MKTLAKIKTRPEDFIVEEIHENWHCLCSKEFKPTTDYRLPTTGEAKAFLWCEMEKKNIEHFQAIKEIANYFGIHPKEIGYAGTKDKIAHTSQRISIPSPDLEKLKAFSHQNIILKNFKWEKRKIKLGYLDGNHFKITLRDIDKKEAIKITNQIRKLKFFPNYFGPQRFGIDGKNLITGRLLIKRKFLEAAKILFPNEEKIRDPLNILRKIPKKILLMHVCSVQSKIFNEIVERALEQEIDLTQKGQQNGILAGYKTRFTQGQLGKIEQQVLKENNVTLEDFDIKEISYLRMKGSYRKALVPIENLQIEIQEDESHKPAKKILLSFTLPSGTYATTFLENFFELEQPQAKDLSREKD